MHYLSTTTRSSHYIAVSHNIDGSFHWYTTRKYSFRFSRLNFVQLFINNSSKREILTQLDMTRPQPITVQQAMHSALLGLIRKRPRHAQPVNGGKHSRQILRSSEKKRFATVAKAWGIFFATWLLFSHLATWRTASASPALCAF